MHRKKKNLCEYPAKEQPSTTQKRGPWKPTLMLSWAWVSSFQNYELIISRLFKSHSMYMYGTSSTLIDCYYFFSTHIPAYFALFKGLMLQLLWLSTVQSFKHLLYSKHWWLIMLAILMTFNRVHHHFLLEVIGLKAIMNSISSFLLSSSSYCTLWSLFSLNAEALSWTAILPQFIWFSKLVLFVTWFLHSIRNGNIFF